MDDITFFLALWGAFLSTYLALREVRKDKRSLKIILEHDTWADMHRLLISNIGHHPVTMEQINLEMASRKPEVVDAIPQNAFWVSEHGKPELPFTLEDSKTAIFYMVTEVVYINHLDF